MRFAKGRSRCRRGIVAAHTLSPSNLFAALPIELQRLERSHPSRTKRDSISSRHRVLPKNQTTNLFPTPSAGKRFISLPASERALCSLQFTEAATRLDRSSGRRRQGPGRWFPPSQPECRQDRCPTNRLKYSDRFCIADCKCGPESKTT